MIITLILVNLKLEAEFFDWFGLITFGFLSTLGIWMFKFRKNYLFWIKFLITLIGILGLIVDGAIIIRTYF